MEFGRKFRDYAIAGGAVALGALGSYNDANAQSIKIKSESNKPILGPGQQFTLEVRADSMDMPGVMLRGASWVAEPSGDVQIMGGYLPSTSNPSTNLEDFFYNILMNSSLNRIDSTIPLTNNIRLIKNSGVGVSDREFKLLGSYDFVVSPNVFDGVSEPYLTKSFDLNSVEFVDLDGNVYNSPDAGTGVDVYNLPFKIARFGDADLNGSVSIGDVTRAAVNFGQPGGWEQGDFNADGTISIGDVTILAENFGLNINPVPLSGEGYSSLSSSVPVPTTFALVGAVGLAGLAGRKRYPNKTLAEIAQGH